MAKDNNHNRFLVEYVKKLQRLNNIELEIPQEPIDSIIENPKEYALNFVEFQVTKNLMKYIEAQKLGKTFALKNMEIKDGEK
tara:strand:+ start:19 stop:264 length:246 start_codon:yes stop_codon:yes gene_type:complete